MTLLHLVAATAIASLLIAYIAWLWRQSRVLAAIAGGTIALQATAAIAAFEISSRGWPVFRALQIGHGFWAFALDSPSYYCLATDRIPALCRDVSGIDGSWFFIGVLKCWLAAVGPSPLSAALLNPVAFGSMCALLIALASPIGDTGRRTALVFALGALSLSPALLIHSTQVLKDQLFAVALATLCATVVIWLDAITAHHDSARKRSKSIGTAAIAVGAVSVIAGLRPYFAVIVLVVFPLAGLVAVVSSGFERLKNTARIGAMWAAMAAAVFVVARSDPAVRWAGATLTTGSRSLQASVNVADDARRGFIQEGGATNVGASIATSARGAPVTFERLKATAVGFSLMFVPISVLKATDAIEVGGGSGLLPVTDIDTLFLDLSTMVVLTILYRSRRRLRAHTAALAFPLLLSAAVFVLMAYVVTNFGTLFRLRPMAFVPLWMIPLALASTAHQTQSESEPPRRFASLSGGHQLQ